MKNLNYGRGHGRNLTMVMLKFWPWSWSKIFDHMTMTPGVGQMFKKSWPPYPPPTVRVTRKPLCLKWANHSAESQHCCAVHFEQSSARETPGFRVRTVSYRIKIRSL